MFALYVKLIAARIRSQMQYRVSFWLELIGFFFVTFIEFAIIAVLVERFGTIGGWASVEVALLYGLASFSLSLAEMIGRGFDSPFERMMQMGSFDGVLARPLGTFFQILAADFQLRRLGRTAQASIVLLYSLTTLPINWSLDRLLLLPLSIASGALVYLSLFVISATICFWTIRAPEVVNIFIFGGEQVTSYPLGIYGEWLRRVFLYIVPLGFANYPVALLLFERSDPYGLPASIAWAAPIMALLFFGVALAFWHYGVSKYTSTGN
jgi:ABC-2 type transport system permease protein